jgi:hypothetical protein
VTCIITQTIILSHFFGYSHKISWGRQ